MAKPKLALIPAAQGSKFYSVLPSSGVGDFDFTRSGSATRINSQGLIETVGNGVSRLNYPLIDGKVVGCPSHLLEPQRINLLPYSEDFSEWILIGSPTIELNNIISPDGILNGTKVTRGSNPTPLRLGTPNILNTENTFTVYAKKGNYDKLNLDIGDQENFQFNLTDDWKRFDITSTPTTYNHVDITLPFSSSGDFIYIWGAQLEQGSYPTSYIPTNGSTVTRSAETANNSGDASTFNDSEGVLMAELSIDANDGNFRFLSISNGNSNNQNVVWIYYRSDTNQINFRVIVGGTSSFDQIYTINNATINTKLLLKYKENDFSAWVNGFEVLTDNLGITFPIGTLNELEFNRPDGVSNFYGNTKQLQYYDTALTDSELEQLTSWVSFSDMAEGQLYTIQ